MKLRVRNNSVRLRLTQGEIAQFKNTGRVEETVEFGTATDACLIYALVAANVNEIGASFEANKITVNVPLTEAGHWINSDQVGLETEQDISNGKTLRILIEKDFACIERRDGEDDSDAFPHPAGQRAY